MIKLVLSGMDAAIAKLDDAIRNHLYSEDMLVEVLQGVSARTLPYIPEDTGALVRSEKRIIAREEGRTVGYVRYGESPEVGRSGTPVRLYARYVHDGPQKDWKKAGASNRFLTQGVDDFLANDWFRIAADHAMVR